MDEAAPPKATGGRGQALLWALVLKLVVVLLLVLAAGHYPGDPRYHAAREPDTAETVWYLARSFDAHAYQRLADEGYYDAFSRNYPLGYPLLIRAARLVTGDLATAAVAVSNLMALVALVLMARLLGRLADRLGGQAPARVAGALLLFAALPGWVVFGSVAYSESSWMVLSLLAWTTWADAPERDGRRPLGRLALASLLTGAAVMVRHAGAFQLVALGVLELGRLLRADDRRRALGEAALSLWAVLPIGAYFAWKYSAHGLAELQDDIWRMRLVPLGGPFSLISAGATPEYVAQILASLPLALLLLVRLARVDGRLAVLAGCGLLLFLSYTGTAAQSLTRYVWTLWPLAAGALALADRAVVLALTGWLLCLSLMVGVGWVLGTAAL